MLNKSKGFNESSKIKGEGTIPTIPIELMGETGVRKKTTELTITTTRFTQLPTEWVTGDTLCKII